MNFLTPLGLIGLAALVPIVALYFLKLKREERVVPSTLLWKKVIDDMQVNSPFQRLKYSLLLLLQLLLVALLGFALARPYLSASGYKGAKTILLIDTSASMSTRDAGRNKDLTRLEAAVREAEIKVDDMRGGDEMMIVAFDRDVRQLTKFTNDRGILKPVLASLQTRDVVTRADQAFETAVSLCEGKDARVLVLSDGCFGNLKMMQQAGAVPTGNIEDGGVPDTPLDRLARQLGNFRFVSYGDEESDNVGITQIDARTRPVKATDENGKRYDALETQIFVMVENFAPKPVDAILSISTGARNFQPKAIHLQGRAPRVESLKSEPGGGTTVEASRSVEVFKLPLGTSGVVSARIDAPKDRFPVDDSAHCIVSRAEGVRLLLVTKGNYFLEKALNSIKGVNITTMASEEFTKQWDQKAQQAVENFDACVFEGVAPLTWTEGGALFLGAMPPLPGFVKGDETLRWPELLDWDISHPAMRYVNFGNVTVAEAQTWTIPKTAKVLVEGKGGPFITAVENDRVRAIGVAFDVFKSDWAYRPSLPLFLRNVVPWIAEASSRRQPTGQRTGDPLVIPPTPGAATASLDRPGGGAPEKIELSAERSTFVKGTDKAGLYYLRDIPEVRTYAVNLGSRVESDNAARSTLKVGEMSLESTRSAIESKREIWKDLALAAGALLLLEWWVFHRRVGM